MKEPEILIRPKVKCNSWTITLSGLIMLAVTLVFAQFFWPQWRFVIMFLSAFSIAIMLLGIFKLLEPNISFFISPNKLIYQHRKGRWDLHWHNINAIFCVSNTHGIERQELNYIGLTLDSLDAIKDHISLRLANHLIHEQQPLVVYCVSHELIKPEQAVINFEAYTCENGEEIKGPLAGFLHQCQTLKQALGAHLYIANGNIDRSIDEFAALLNACKTASKCYQ